MIKYALLAGIAGAFLSAAAAATPLTLTYVVTDLGDKFRYDFVLTLDNHDGTWAEGQEWDWIIFGDNDFNDTHTGFDPDGAGPISHDWEALDFDPLITGFTNTFGGHNGPTLELSTNTVSLPGWEPTAVGDKLTWSGTSSLFIADGDLVWSSLITGGGARFVDFEVAHLVDVSPLPNPVPEPGMLGLLGLGLAGLGASRRRGSRRQA